MGVMVLLPESLFPDRDGTGGLVTCSCGTDNQGNSYLVEKLLTTKYPLGLLLIELLYQCSIRGAKLQARWILTVQCLRGAVP